MNYKKKRLTDAQFQINNKQKFDTKATNVFLKENGLTEADVISICIPNTYEFYWNTSALKAMRCGIRPTMNWSRSPESSAPERL